MATHTVHKFEQGWVTALAFDPNDHKRVFVATRHGLFAWDWKSEAKLQKLFANDARPGGEKVFDSPVASLGLAISPAGRHIALIDHGERVAVIGLEPKQIKLKSVAVAQEARKRGLETFAIESGALTFTPDSSTIAHTRGDEITLHDVKARKELRRLKGHTGVVGSLCFIDNDTLISGSWDGTCRVWTVKNGSSKLVPSKVQPEACPLVACSGDGKRFACTYNGEIAVFSFPEQKEVKRIQGPKSGFTGIAFWPDSRSLITTGEAPRPQFWDIVEGKELKKK